MDGQVEPLNEAQERKQAEREEVVPCIELPIGRIVVKGCLSGKINEFEKLLSTLESYQDNGEFRKHDHLVKNAIHKYEEIKDFTMVLALKIEKSATYSYQGDWNHAKKLLDSVIESDLLAEYSDIIKARAFYLLVAHMRRKEDYRKSKTDLLTLFDYLERSIHLLHNYNSPEDWAELYQTYFCVWIDYLDQLPIDKRAIEREKAMDCFYRVIYYSEQDGRKRVKMKRQSYIHIQSARMLLGSSSTIVLAQENFCTLNDIKEAEKHLDAIQFKFGDNIPKATTMLRAKTQSDLLYRQGQYQQAKDKAEDAYKDASHHKFNTELNTLKERKDLCQKKLETHDQIQASSNETCIVQSVGNSIDEKSDEDKNDSSKEQQKDNSDFGDCDTGRRAVGIKRKQESQRKTSNKKRKGKTEAEKLQDSLAVTFRPCYSGRRIQTSQVRAAKGRIRVRP